MPRIFFFLIFLLLSALIIFGMNFFLYGQIKSVYNPGRRMLISLRYLLLILNSTFFVGILTSQLLRWYPVFDFSFYWLGFISGAFFLTLGGWIISRILPSCQKWLTGAALVLSVLVFIYSAWRGAQPPVVRTFRIQSQKLPAEAHFKIVHLSDLHLNNNQREENNLAYIVEAVNRLQPDLVAITGDILDEDISGNHRLKEILIALQARHGVYLVTGNHEFYHGLDRFSDYFSPTPFKILRNEFKELSPKITVTGLDDPEIRNTEKYLDKEDTVFRNLRAGKFNILLYHRPTFFHRFSDLGIDLQLSGHTHNGQMFPMELIVQLVYRYPWGLYQRGSSFLYTSCGTGVWGPKMRTFSRSEIVQIVINPRPRPLPYPRQR